jgi:putative transcriptional regulator
MAESTPQLRLRLKADGRVVEILPDGRERPVAQSSATEPAPAPSPGSSRLASRLASLAPPPARPKTDADYARAIRAATKLTQAEFAERIGVPIETVRNWEQGKRSPRGPARALLKVIEQAPDLAFAALAPSRARP